MIGVIFSFFDDVIEVRIDKNDCIFRTGKYGGAFVPIDGLRLDKDGVIKEHPDLKDRDDWRQEAIKRFKEHIKTIDTEDKQVEYIISELSKCGYKPIAKQRAGFRPEKIK